MAFVPGSVLSVADTEPNYQVQIGMGGAERTEQHCTAMCDGESDRMSAVPADTKMLMGKRPNEKMMEDDMTAKMPWSLSHEEWSTTQ